jgi:hypothetical protein
MIYPLTRAHPRYREFQDRVWQDVPRARPSFILTTNIPTYLLWDGRAGFGSAGAEIEAVLPVREPKASVILVENGRPDADFSPGEHSIYVYRRKRW